MTVNEAIKTDRCRNSFFYLKQYPIHMYSVLHVKHCTCCPFSAQLTLSACLINKRKSVKHIAMHAIQEAYKCCLHSTIYFIHQHIEVLHM